MYLSAVITDLHIHRPVGIIILRAFKHGSELWSCDLQERAGISRMLEREAVASQGQ